MFVSFNTSAGLFGGAAIVQYREVIGHIDRQSVTASRKECESIAADFSYKSAIRTICNTVTHDELSILATNYYSLNCDNVINEKDAEIDDDSIKNPMIVKEGRVGNDEFCKSMETTKEQKTETPSTTTEPNQAKTWTGDWGDGIIAVISSEACQNPEFLKQGYNYAMSVSIPSSRLKQSADAWQISNDRAITIIGCWFKKEGGVIHTKMIRKKGDKVSEQDFKLDDGNWTAK